MATKKPASATTASAASKPAGDKLKVLLIIGSVKENRFADRVVKFVQPLFEKKNFQVDVLDPQVAALPLLKKPLFFYKDPKEAPAVLLDIQKRIKEADAFVVVSCEYNHSIPPALSNTIDHFAPNDFGFRPSGIITYSPGQFGGVRAAMQLRSFLGEVGCISVKDILAIGTVHEQIDEKGQTKSDTLVASAEKMIAQVEWHAQAMKNHRLKVGTPS